jgi:hypothetical protein
MKQQELLQQQTGAEKQNTPSKPLYEREQIENSPFWIIGNEEEGFNITMGKYKITQEPVKTKLDALLWLEAHKWDVVLTVALCAYTDMKYSQKDTNKK